MTDQPSVHAWLRARLAQREFHHRDHLELTWLAIAQHGAERAGDVVTALLPQVAAAHGRPERYHETLTRFWVRLLVHVRERRPDLLKIDAAIQAFPLLLDQELPFRHWSRPAMAGDQARMAWVEPDLVPLSL
ncbi:MAG: hypothetical protein J2P45_05060 [Candidatus Dormibacteraeota bacterium]|nr:hypothetical protein [Candidatus Dormibacteraeota bacterium]